MGFLIEQTLRNSQVVKSAQSTRTASGVFPAQNKNRAVSRRRNGTTVHPLKFSQPTEKVTEMSQISNLCRSLALLSAVSLATLISSASAFAQDATTAGDATDSAVPIAADPVAGASTVAADEPVADGAQDKDKWDRLIYVPFRELQKVFDNQAASVVVPYAEYMELLRVYMQQLHPANGVSPDAVVTSSTYTARVEKDVVRISAELKLNVLKEAGWATIPLSFGSAAIGRIAPDDGTILLKGVTDGQYELLVSGSGTRTVTLELLATVKTSPEDKSFQINCPPTGISELQFTIPEADQTVQVSPLQVLLPVEAAAEGSTAIRASLGAVGQFTVRWNPRAGTKPVMDLLASASNETTVAIESGLVQSKTIINYEILRGELREVQVLVPKDARIIDVVSTSGRIRAWNATAVGETHQQVVIELLTPVSGRFQIELQTERNPAGDTFQLIGRSEDGKLQGVHADAVVRESGRIVIATDPSLTAVIKSQQGVKRVDAGSQSKSGDGADGRQAWEFSGTTGQLVVQTRPVEPRLLVTHDAQIVFRDDELRLRSLINYSVERAGVFQLELAVPESLTVDSVSADGMSEFHVDKGSGKITLSLTQKRMGAIAVTVHTHQSFDAAAENAEIALPTITPSNVERETGVVTVYAPQFLDVITVDEKLIGLFPARDVQPQELSRLRHIATWNFTRRPIALFVRTSPRPAQLAATVGTTARVEPDVIKLSSAVTFDIQNAGLDTLRIAVPEAIASDVRFRAVTPGHNIQQRNKAEQAEDGWVTWTLVLQEESTGSLQVAVEWEVTLDKTAADTTARDFTIEPPRVLTPFTAEQAERRRVTLTQARGEIRILRHESLSITAEKQGETTEAIDVRELELMEQDGYLAFRYFSQPASATVKIRKHEIHEVVATVISKSAIEVVTEKQQLAAYRARFRMTTSERQRLRVDLPESSDLQAPLLNGTRTTIERATDLTAAKGWDAYYVNVSREQNSDVSFLLTLQFRCPIIESNRTPYGGRGGLQTLRLPTIGDDSGATAVQQIQLALWAPRDIAFVGEPDRWTQIGQAQYSLLRPLDAPTSPAAATAFSDWLDDPGSGSGDFPTQGHVAVYRAVGRQSEVQAAWWNRPFLFWLISGALVVIGLLLRNTSWENRISLLLLSALAVALWSLKDNFASGQFVGAAVPGLLVVAGIWLTGALFGRGNGNGSGSGPSRGNGGSDTSPRRGSDGGNSPPPAPLAPAPVSTSEPQGSQSHLTGITHHPATVSPAPEVADMMNDLMGGKPQ